MELKAALEALQARIKKRIKVQWRNIAYVIKKSYLYNKFFWDMTTALKINTQNFKLGSGSRPQRALSKCGLGNSSTEIPDAADVMSKPEVWEVITMLDWWKSDNGQIVEPLAETFSRILVAKIYQFYDILFYTFYWLCKQKG